MMHITQVHECEDVPAVLCLSHRLLLQIACDDSEPSTLSRWNTGSLTNEKCRALARSFQGWPKILNGDSMIEDSLNPEP